MTSTLQPRSHNPELSKYSTVTEYIVQWLPRRRNSTSLRDFIAYIATIKGDLSNITAPPFLLASQSTTQYPRYWAENPSTFTAPAKESDPEKRALLVLKWFLASLKRQQYGGRQTTEGVKKPLNAVLGELFLAEWKQEGVAGTTRLVSEQVSHHPPVTACYLWNDECGIRAEGYTLQEITFTGSVNIKQVGHAILHVDKYDEDYLIPLPDVKVRGLLTGSPYPELNGTYYITSSTGIVSSIDFSGRGFISGQRNSVEAKVYRPPETDDVLFAVKGQWSDRFTITDVRKGEEIETVDVNNVKLPEMSVPPLDQQDPWESQRVWADVTRALDRGDMGGTSVAKSALEQAQRDMRARERQEGTKWTPLFFRSEPGDDRFDKLATTWPRGLEAERTKGVWKFDRERFDMSMRPFRGGLTPAGTRLSNGDGTILNGFRESEDHAAISSASSTMSDKAST